MIAAGKLNRRITITQPATVAQNSFGEVTSGQTAGIEVWAEIIPVSVREINIAKTYGTSVNTKITIRYRALDRTWRITDDRGLSYNINGFIDPDSLKRDLVVYATAVLP